jgi:hypothetical protein
MSIPIFNDDIKEYPTYLLIVNQSKLDKFQNRFTYFLRRRMLIQNNIHLMLDNYDYDSKKEGKQMLFYENNIKYKTIYKRFRINNQFIYTPIEDYGKFLMNYKIKICTLIAETLGVSLLRYNYNEFAQSQLNIVQDLSVENIQVSGNYNNQETKSVKNVEVKEYQKGICKYLFNPIHEYEENIFKNYGEFLDINHYRCDLELRNLVHSRLIGCLFDYDVKYETKFIETKELEFITSFYSKKNFGIKLKEITNKKLNISIKIKFYKYEELINSDNMWLDDKCLQLIKKNKSINLLKNFVEKHIKSNSSQNVYYFMKIAKSEYLNKLINNINTIDDLKEDGSFFTSLKSTLYSSLLTFDDIGLSKLQDIYIMKLRNNRNIESDNLELDCFDIRCNKEICSCRRYKSLKSIYCYIIRAYNNANPEIITYGFRNKKIFAITIHYIIMNLKHFTSYDMFINFITKSINDCLKNINNEINEPSKESTDTNKNDITSEILIENN